MTATQVIDVLSANLDLVVAVQQGLFSALSGLCALCGWTKPSKVLGTLTALDLGRVVRYAKQISDVKKALSATAKVGLVLLLAGCSGAPPTLPTVCPIPSEYLRAIPAPSAVADAVQRAENAVETAKTVAEDPKASAVVLLAAQVLDTVEPLCPSLESVAALECSSKVADARSTLAKSDATRKDVCDAVKLAVIVAQVADNSAPISALEEVCR